MIIIKYSISAFIIDDHWLYWWLSSLIFLSFFQNVEANLIVYIFILV